MGVGAVGARARPARRRRRRRAAAPRRLGRRWPAASAAASTGCPAPACPTAASTSGRASSIPLGGTALCVLAALLAFWPRRGGLGFPAAALVLLVSLYAVPAVALDFGAEYLRGVAARPSWSSASCGWSGCAAARPAPPPALALAAAVCALALAPALDGGEPWLDYETWALEHRRLEVDGVLLGPPLRPAGLAARRARDAARPRTPAGLLEGAEPRRVRRHPWEVDRFGAASRQRPTAQIPDVAQRPALEPAHPRERAQPAHPHVHRRGRRLRHRSTRAARASRPAGSASSAARTLQPRRRLLGAGLHPEPDRAPAARGRAVATASSSASTASSSCPTTREPRLGRGRSAARSASPPSATPARAGRLRPGRPRQRRQRRGRHAGAAGRRADRAPTPSRATCARARAAAVRLRAPRRALPRRSATSAIPRRPRAAAQRLAGLPLRRQVRLLPAVLGRDGAAAADGRRAGPRRHRLHARAPSTARRASRSCATSTRTRGSRCSSPVRLGHARPDARRRAAALAPGRGRRRAQAARPGAPIFGGERATDPRLRRPGRDARAARRGGSTRWAASRCSPWRPSPCCCGAVAARGAPAVGRGRAAARARARAAPRRAARPRRARRSSGLEAGFGRTPAAAGYVRALREARYSGRPAEPTSAQRRGLRGELARGEGLAGRLRAWWALPPRPVRRG